MRDMLSGRPPQLVSGLWLLAKPRVRSITSLFSLVSPVTRQSFEKALRAVSFWLTLEGARRRSPGRPGEPPARHANLSGQAGVNSAGWVTPRGVNVSSAALHYDPRVAGLLLRFSQGAKASRHGPFSADGRTHGTLKYRRVSGAFREDLWPRRWHYQSIIGHAMVPCSTEQQTRLN